eukprot:1743715-Lingulodinium_polyedra.AAC.1
MYFLSNITNSIDSNDSPTAASGRGLRAADVRRSNSTGKSNAFCKGHLGSVGKRVAQRFGELVFDQAKQYACSA